MDDDFLEAAIVALIIAGLVAIIMVLLVVAGWLTFKLLDLLEIPHGEGDPVKYLLVGFVEFLLAAIPRLKVEIEVKRG